SAFRSASSRLPRPSRATAEPDIMRSESGRSHERPDFLRLASDFRLADGSGKLAGEIVIEEASMRLRPMQLVLGTALLAAGSYPLLASAADKLDCEMRFSLRGWSAIYKHSEGSGVITCSNGKSYPVVITATGGGLTVGKQEIDDGLAKFSEVVRVSELY